MKIIHIYILSLVCVALGACNRDNVRGNRNVEIPDFDFPQTAIFEPHLSAYQIFEGTPADLTPADDFHLVELRSILYTDQAQKQRLLKVPPGTQMLRRSDGSIDFPDGTILTKTFYYHFDARDTSLGKRIIETRLLVKESDTWNAATYVWNDAQTDAVLRLDGLDTQVSWVAADGASYSTLYHVPDENECIACHQSDENMVPLGSTLRNMNRPVIRNGNLVHQLQSLQAEGILNDFPVTEVPQIVDYNDPGASLHDRGRAYLAMNCAHCHHPSAWEVPAGHDLDLRYEIPLAQTGIEAESKRITAVVVDEEMPFIGTTLIDEEGVGLIIDFIESL